MNNIVLCLIAGSIALTGCLPSTYQEGMTIIGLPEPLPSDEQRQPASARHHDEQERFKFSDWLQECEGKLGSEIPTQTIVTMNLPTFDLEEGWSARTPQVTVSARHGAPTPVARFLDDFSLESGDHAIGITAVLGRFTLERPNTEALARLSDYTRSRNKGEEDEERLWFSRASRDLWKSGLIALSLELVDGDAKAQYSPFFHWLRETDEKEAVTLPQFQKLRVDELLAQEAVIGPKLVGAEGLVSFDAIAITLVRHDALIGCLPVNH